MIIAVDSSKLKYGLINSMSILMPILMFTFIISSVAQSSCEANSGNSCANISSSNGMVQILSGGNIQIEPMQVLEMINNDPASVQDIPRWAKRAGHQFLKLFKEGDNFHFLIRKGI